jgi:hypothetical protein
MVEGVRMVVGERKRDRRTRYVILLPNVAEFGLPQKILSTEGAEIGHHSVVNEYREEGRYRSMGNTKALDGSTQYSIFASAD